MKFLNISTLRARVLILACNSLWLVLQYSCNKTRWPGKGLPGGIFQEGSEGSGATVWHLPKGKSDPNESTETSNASVLSEQGDD